MARVALGGSLRNSVHVRKGAAWYADNLFCLPRSSPEQVTDNLASGTFPSFVIIQSMRQRNGAVRAHCILIPLFGSDKHRGRTTGSRASIAMQDDFFPICLRAIPSLTLSRQMAEDLILSAFMGCATTNA
jgi:hypothetical protein